MGRKPSHGMRFTKEYHAWSHMKDRCLNPKNHAYREYGGRGITVCERWLTFENFFADMGLAPTGKYTLERKENDKGYYPTNCVWATPAEQNKNKRNTPMMTIDGITKPKHEWLNQYGIERTAFNKRIKKGYSEKDALTIPARKRNIGKTMPKDSKPVS